MPWYQPIFPRLLEPRTNVLGSMAVQEFLDQCDLLPGLVERKEPNILVIELPHRRHGCHRRPADRSMLCWSGDKVIDSHLMQHDLLAKLDPYAELMINTFASLTSGAILLKWVSNSSLLFAG